MNESICSNSEEALKMLNELVLDHLGIPRPGQSEYIKTLQDDLLPLFVEVSRQAWLAAHPILPSSDNRVYQYLSDIAKSGSDKVKILSDTLEELGVHDLLESLADSRHLFMMGDLPIDAYDERLLKVAGYPNPASALREILCRTVQDPGLISSPRENLDTASKKLSHIDERINIYVNLSYSPTGSAKPDNTGPDETKKDNAKTAKPRSRKLFKGLGKLFSGFVLLTGNGIAIPSVSIGTLAALPLLSSFAGGIASVGEGISELKTEGTES